MNAEDIMTENPACCTPETQISEVARMMRDEDVGEIPVVQSAQEMSPLGVVTDRDIVVRIVAEGQNTMDKRAGDIMSSPVVTVQRATTLEEAAEIMAHHKIRRVPVVDESGQICGIVAQADIAMNAAPDKSGEVVAEVSEPAGSARR